MRNSYLSIDTFLQEVLNSTQSSDSEQAQRARATQGHLCPTATDLAVHLILELYDHSSSHHANTTRICSNLELAAEELLYLSRRIRGAGSEVQR